MVGKIGKENLVGLLMEKLENDKGPNYNLSQTTVTLCFPSCHRQTFRLQAGKSGLDGREVGWLKIAEERGIMGEMTTEKYSLI